MKNIFIIGSKGIPANYGGFETFVEQLTRKKISQDIKYHVSCLSDQNGEFEHNGARCFNVKVPGIGSSKAVLYDILSLMACIKYIKTNKIENSSVYILACRIGPFIGLFKKKLKKLGVKVYVNPDGHEWKRSKWNKFIRMYWKYSEKLMVKHSDLIICDSRGIENYIKREYAGISPTTTFIAYGADITHSSENADKDVINWFRHREIDENNYYLIVGRFVPENNYELIVREFMKSETKKDLVIVTDIKDGSFKKNLLEKTRYDQDARIKFVGTVYDQDYLKLIRENAFAYIHGHEVGGTNPSLLEALGSTKLNILLDVVFNKEVAEECAIYFSKDKLSFRNAIEFAESLNAIQIDELGLKSKMRINEEYSWEKIVLEYENLFG